MKVNRRGGKNTPSGWLVAIQLRSGLEKRLDRCATRNDCNNVIVRLIQFDIGDGCAGRIRDVSWASADEISVLSHLRKFFSGYNSAVNSIVTLADVSHCVITTGSTELPIPVTCQAIEPAKLTSAKNETKNLLGEDGYHIIAYGILFY